MIYYPDRHLENVMDNLKTTAFYLPTKKIIHETKIKNSGSAYLVDKDNFPALDNITSYALEIWEECMRIPHWHPNAFELGYIVSGEIEVLIWRSAGETAMFTLSAGMCWFIPQGALHSLNNIGKEKAVLVVGFSASRPQHLDLPVAYNGIPVVIRDVYTSPHSELRKWTGVMSNPLLGAYSVNPDVKKIITGSPYGFNLAATPPLFDHADMGSVVWAVKNNWEILQDISLLRARLKKNIARDPIWYPDSATLYVVTKGHADFHIIISGIDPVPFQVNYLDYIFVPAGVLHTFINTSAEDFEVIAFFPKANPLPEVSLSVATGFFPGSIRNAALTKFGGENLQGEPLKRLNNTTVTPYLLRIK